MNFPSKPAGIHNEDFEFIFACVFLCFIIYKHSLHLVLIALVTVALFGEVGEMACRCCLEFTVFRLFDDADIDIAARCTIRVSGMKKFNALVCSRRNSPSELQSLQTFGTPKCGRFLYRVRRAIFLAQVQMKKLIRMHLL